MFCLRVLLVVIQDLQFLPSCLHVCIIRVISFYHFTKFPVLHLPAYEINVLPEGIILVCLLYTKVCLDCCYISECPIIMYGLRLFVLQGIPNSLHVCIIISPCVVALHLSYLT